MNAGGHDRQLLLLVVIACVHETRTYARVHTILVHLVHRCRKKACVFVDWSIPVKC
jgi:hypothetical protein